MTSPMMRTTCMTLVVGTSMSMAVAQTQNDRDNQNRNNQSTPQHDATRSQPGTNTGTSWNNQNTNRDLNRDQNAYGQNRSFMDEYFGRPSSETADYTKLRDLSGAWKLHVTMYDPNSSDSRVMRTATGYAERRWILNGTKLAESYTLDGDHNALPFRGLGMNAQGRNANWNDRDGMHNRDAMNQDRMNRDQMDRDRDNMRRDNTNDPNRNNNNNNNNNNNDNNNQNRPNDQGSGTGTPTPGATGASGNQPVNSNPASSNSQTSSTSGTGTGVNWNNQNNTTTPNSGTTTASSQDTRGTNTGSSNNRMAASSSGMGKGVCLYGYDAADREFTVAWMDDQSSAIRFDEGKLGTDNELTLTGKYVDPRDNKTYQTKTIITMDGPNQQRVTMYRDGGILSKEVKVFEITYTRDTNPMWISPNPGNAYGTVPTDNSRSEP